MKRSYYKAAGKSLELVNELIALRKNIIRLWREYGETFGAVDGVRTGVGVRFVDGPPAGWKRHPRDKESPTICIPDRRTKAGKAVAEALSKLPMTPGEEWLGYRMGYRNAYRVDDDGAFWPPVGILGTDGVYVLKIRYNDTEPPAPEGAEPLTAGQALDLLAPLGLEPVEALR